MPSTEYTPIDLDCEFDIIYEEYLIDEDERRYEERQLYKFELERELTDQELDELNSWEEW